MAILPRIQENKAWYNPTRYEFGASEAVSKLLNKPVNAQGGSNIFGASVNDGGQVLGSNITAPQGGVQYPSPISPSPRPATPTGAGQSSGLTFPTPSITAPNQSPGGNAPSEVDQINSEFDTYQNFLNSQEQVANQNFGGFEKGIRTDAANATQQADNQLTQQTGVLNEKAAQGRENQRLDLSKVRQLLADLDQKNAARMAITGGGSTSEALADRFSRTAQQNVGSVLTEGRRYQNDISSQVTKANQFYTEKKAAITADADARVNQARQVLQENLSNINNDRRSSADARGRARLDAWKSYLGQVNQAKLQAANFQSTYDMWKKQFDAQVGAMNNYQVAAPNWNAYQGGTMAGTGVTQTTPTQTVAPTAISFGYKNPNEQVDAFGNPIVQSGGGAG